MRLKKGHSCRTLDGWYAKLLRALFETQVLEYLKCNDPTYFLCVYEGRGAASLLVYSHERRSVD